MVNRPTQELPWSANPPTPRRQTLYPLQTVTEGAHAQQSHRYARRPTRQVCQVRGAGGVCGCAAERRAVSLRSPGLPRVSFGRAAPRRSGLVPEGFEDPDRKPAATGRKCAQWSSPHVWRSGSRLESGARPGTCPICRGFSRCHPGHPRWFGVY